ncbi:MAG TPA: TMEM175 family protein [Acidimicrobiales bacterium]|nr:TMEM175 family protein [Acidimicrobiales bacterium]
MQRETGFRRLVSFSDAVVAIAIMLLILPLVDSASSIGNKALSTFFSDNQTKLLAFALSFAVIGSFWWGQHQVFERVRAYNSVLVWGMFLWLLSIVFLPFPTELIGTVTDGTVAVHAIYIGTMLVAAIGALVQQWAIVRWPELQEKADDDVVTIDSALILVALMGVALVMTIVFPSVGLWPLLVLLLSRPLERLAAARRRSVRPAES